MRKWPAQVGTVVAKVGRELSLLKMAINMANADYLSFFLWNELEPRCQQQAAGSLELVWLVLDMGPSCPTLMTRLLVATSSEELADRWILGKTTWFLWPFLKCCVIAQCVNTCSSSWIKPVGHRRRFRGIRDHRPVSMRDLWDDKRNREKDILYASDINIASFDQYTECTSQLGFMVRYVTNLLLLDTPSLWSNALFAAPVWSKDDKSAINMSRQFGII